MDRIESFQETFLSNFFPVEIFFNGKVYPSVENAYQAQKFEKNVLKNIPVHLFEKCLEHTQAKGVGHLFGAQTTAVGAKAIATILRLEGGIQRERWDEQRVEIMIELLIRKFSVAANAKKLMGTTNLYLLEGNDWGDTFWGDAKKTGS